MNVSKLVIAAVLLFGGVASASAAEPTFTWWSMGQFRTGGYYPMGYHIYADDVNGDLLQLKVVAHYERDNFWRTAYGSGNYWHKECHDWGESLDGYSAAFVHLTDTVGTYTTEIELVF